MRGSFKCQEKVLREISLLICIDAQIGRSRGRREEEEEAEGHDHAFALQIGSRRALQQSKGQERGRRPLRHRLRGHFQAAGGAHQPLPRNQVALEEAEESRCRRERRL